MKVNRRIRTFLFVIIFVFSFPASVSAKTFNDIAEEHWAYHALDQISELGFFVGDTEGNFMPSKTMDKFDACIVLARMMGFKYADITPEEQAAYDAAVNKYKNLLAQYSAKFAKWKSGANRELSYLLSISVLEETDLYQFVVLIDDQEKVRDITREEVCVLLVKYLNKQNELPAAFPLVFNDDASISATAKPYVYCLRQLGIVNGDPSNNFNPKNSLSRVELAFLICQIYTYKYPDFAVPAPTSSPSPSDSSQVSGTILKMYSSYSALQISSPDKNFDAKIYLIDSNADITINGMKKSYADLREGMVFTGVVKANKLVEIKISDSSVSTMKSTLSIKSSPAPAPTALPSAEITTIKGFFAGSKTVSGQRFLDVSIQKSDDIPGLTTFEAKTYPLAENCIFTYGNYVFSMEFPNSLRPGDAITVTLTGTEITNVVVPSTVSFATGILEKVSKSTITISELGSEC